jgi:glycosyltransferase involved in cell wall biosynthesis
MDGPRFETIVVDNTPGDPETRRVAARASARYVIAARVGLSRARNAGIRAATSDLIAFLDDDAVADAAWLRQHTQVLTDASLMASTGRILPMDTEDGQGLDLGDEAFVVDRSDPWWFERANFGGVGAGGSNMVVKRRAFEHGLWFRETLGLGADLAAFEEHYLFFKMIEGGARVAYVPAAIVRHGPPGVPAENESPHTALTYRYNAAYLTMLLVEEPAFRSRTVRYAVQACRREALPWPHVDGFRRERPTGRDRHLSSRLKMIAAACRGALLYLRGHLGKR